MTDNLAFSLSEVSRLLRRSFDRRAREIGVTRAQWHTLSRVARNEGLTQGALAELLEVEPITACRMIDRLEEAGHVERRPDPEDRRKWRLHLTAAARPLIDDLRAIGADVTEEALAGLSKARRDALAATLAAMRANLVEADEATLAGTDRPAKAETIEAGHG